MSLAFIEEAKLLGLTITPTQEKQFDQYYELLVEWNKVMNLTGITEYREVETKHFIDSLAGVKAYPSLFANPEKIHLIDIGTGAGFPGIPLKILYPSVQVTLLDSLKKRISFLETIVDTLHLQDVELIHGRAEDFAKKVEYRERYNLCVSRAVANLATLSEYALPFISEDGYFLSYKSNAIEEERKASLKAIEILGGNIQDTVSFMLPNTEIDRSFVLIKKISKTPKKYPRKAGLPAKEPLGIKGE